MTGSRKRHITSILCCVFGILALSFSDALAKTLTPHYSPLQLLFVRAMLATVTVVGVMLPTMGRHVFRTNNLAVHGFRGAVNVSTAFCFYMSLSMLPLATSTAVAFCAPFFVILFAALVERVRVSPANWLSVGLGFVGVVVATRPEVTGPGVGVVFALLTALGYATLMISARNIKGSEPMKTLLVYIVLGQLLFSSFFQPWVWKPVAVRHWPEFAGLAFFSTIGLTLVSHAFRSAPASLIAPLEYSGLLWAALLGWIFWNEVPDSSFYVGAALIIVSGLCIVFIGNRKHNV